MFENKTVESIQADLLSNVSDDYEKSKGHILYDTLKSFAVEEATIYLALDYILKQMNVDNLTGDDLTKFVYQRKGVVRKLANASKTSLIVNGTGTITIGDIFATKSNIQYKSLETKNILGTGTINVQAVIAGASGNTPANTIIQMPLTLQGITSITNPNVVYDGYDEETDDALRQRYYEILRTPATSGNKYHYLIWAKEVNNVGDALVFSTFAGNNTVKVVIVDANKQPASTDLVTTVQNYIDPKGEYDSITERWSTWGKGIGQAPLSGAYCTVESATGKVINVKVKLTKSSSSYTDADIITNIKKNLADYFKDIALKSTYVSFARIGNLILESEGVSDYDNSTLLINDSQSNVIISLTETLTEVPIVGDVTLL